MRYAKVSREPREQIIYATGTTRTYKADCKDGFFAPLGKSEGVKEIKIQILDIIDLKGCVLFRPADKYDAAQRNPTDYKQIFFTQDDGIVRDFLVKHESATNIEVLEELIQAQNKSAKYICDFEVTAKMVQRRNAEKKANFWAIEFAVGEELSELIQARNQAFIQTLGESNALFSVRTMVEFIHYKKNVSYLEVTKDMLLHSLIATSVIPNSKKALKELSPSIGEPEFDEDLVTETETENH